MPWSGGAAGLGRAGGAEDGLAEADDGVDGAEAGAGVGDRGEGGLEVFERVGEGVGDLLFAGASDDGLEGLDPGLDLRLLGPEKGFAGGEGAGVGKGEEVAAGAEELVEKGPVSR